ncbi:MAG: hypothetical protein A2Y78_04810 [Acidobacteria bacterium RBG_13_68_16]|nr:MAG: hypothetical protein A2Y78_04810 [Acidobacteria bacterium RBG_13_68_16]
MNEIERALVPVWRAISYLRRGSGSSGGTYDECPTFVATGDPKVYTMPHAYLQDSIDVTIGPIRLWPGTDFTAAGTIFTLAVGHWPSGVPAGQTLRVFRARRT